MRLFLSTLGIFTLLSLAGCVGAEAPDDAESEEDVGTAPSAQIDPGIRTYAIKQSSVLVASAWAGTIASGAQVEYWAAKPAYSASAARTFEGASQSCSSWKRSVCASSWSGATYYQAVFSQQTLNCALPPGPCQPAAGATSFLGSGTYTTFDAAGAFMASTYVNGGCEQWAMHQTIHSYADQTVPLFGFASHSAFINAVCAMSPVPSTYFEASYVPLANACSSIVC